MTAPATLPDDELVRLARAGRRDAFAVLFHRHAARIHRTLGAASSDDVAARATTVAVFSDLLRHLHEVEPERLAGALDQFAARRVRGHRLTGSVPPLTVGTLDEMWRELDRRWPDGEPPRRDVSALVPVLAGALVAVLVLGALASTSRRDGIPDPSRSFEAVAMQDDGPFVLPGMLRPTVEPTAPASPTQEPTASPSATLSPAATAEPTPEVTAEPTETATPTEVPDAAPVVEIRDPADGSTRMSDGEDEQGAYATVTLDAVATDDRDTSEALTVAWTSSVDGALAGARSATVRLHVPDGQLTASHVLTFTATDTAGNTASASVTVFVTRV